jgi:FMN phosphatase YigB (HAD superfamily)
MATKGIRESGGSALAKAHPIARRPTRDLLLYAFRFDMARRALASAAWVSFDLFDTLLRRLKGPDEVAADAASGLVGLGLSPWTSEEVLRHRRAWVISREAGYPQSEAEWSIADWYEALGIAMGVDAATVREAGCRCELEAEIAGTMVRPTGLALLLEARRLGQRHFVLSDTTLTAGMIIRLLEAHGLFGLEVVASSEWQRSKRRGTIFAEVEARLGLDGLRGLHIGDNLKSDFVRPLQAGWRAAHLPLTEPEGELDAAARTVLRYPGPAADGRPEPLAGEAAHFVLATAAWVCLQERLLAAEVTLFLARDAEPLLAACDALQPAVGQRQYLRLSRRSVLLAHPGDLLFRVTLSGKIGKQSMRAFVAGFELPDGVAERWLSELGSEADAPLSDATIAAWREVLRRNAAEYDAMKEEQRLLLGDYLRGIIGVRRRLLVVDLGWAGTIQDAIAAVLPACEVHGCYAGVTRGGDPSSSRASKQGLVFDIPAGRGAPLLGTSAGVMRLWELLLREPAGSVRRLVRDEAGVVSAELDRPPPLTAAALELAHEARSRLLETARVAGPSYAQLLALQDDVCSRLLERIARRAWEGLTLLPDGAFARRILDIEMDEGASRGVLTTLGIGGLRSGVSWWPGLVVASLTGRGAGRP